MFYLIDIIAWRIRDKNVAINKCPERETKRLCELDYALWAWKTEEDTLTLHACYKLSQRPLLREQNEPLQQQGAEI